MEYTRIYSRAAQWVLNLRNKNRKFLTSLNWLKNNNFLVLQNRPLWRRQLSHSTQTSARMSAVFRFWKQKEVRRCQPNLKNTVDGAAVHSLIHQIWLWTYWRCNLVHYDVGKAIIFFNKWIFFRIVSVDNTLWIPKYASYHHSDFQSLPSSKPVCQM